ncbi:hypothetical protein P885DRAFT_57057 [Corynascus similis CBS 632.67]
MNLTGILRGFKIPQSAYLRAKLVLAGDTDSELRLFVPQRQGHARSTHGYVAYAYTMVYSQRMIDHPRDLPEQAPPGFVELRREVLGIAEEEETTLPRVAGMQGAEGEGANLLFIVVTDEREFPLDETFMRQRHT